MFPWHHYNTYATNVFVPSLFSSRSRLKSCHRAYNLQHSKTDHNSKLPRIRSHEHLLQSKTLMSISPLNLDCYMIFHCFIYSSFDVEKKFHVRAFIDVYQGTCYLIRKLNQSTLVHSKCQVNISN